MKEIPRGQTCAFDEQGEKPIRDDEFLEAYEKGDLISTKPSAKGKETY